jgi:acyl-CoA reductase-like NAD-dependent aldehyde dehydrogenase
MSQKTFDPSGQAGTMISGRVTKDQAAWLDGAWRELGFSTRSEMLRRLIELAQEHKEELAAAS